MSKTVTVTGDIPDAVVFNSEGLVPVVVQDAISHKVLMMAWMDREAIRRTVENGRVTYFSRSRQEYWEKGESSGNVQQARSLALDCDGDTLLLSVDQTGPACHTGWESCFEAHQ